MNCEDFRELVLITMSERRETVRDVARLVGTSKNSVYRWLDAPSAEYVPAWAWSYMSGVGFELVIRRRVVPVSGQPS